ncbi:PIN domain-containing protein [Clostridiaceae bacterium AF31-3BH]|nr:PIN domain-containing protein [Clostridiaceae bacterium AF31-3BH]
MMQCNKIVDLRTYASINNTRNFFLDTNVLYWYTYPRFLESGQLTTTAQIYYNFIDSLTAAGNPLITSVYNLTELLNVIEKNEFDIYCHLHPDLPITRKDFRKMSSERREVGKIMQTALNNVKELCTVVDFNFSQTAVNSFANTFTNHRCDVFDYAILNNCINSQFLNIISDDSDFSTMEKITLYTANEKIL